MVNGEVEELFGGFEITILRVDASNEHTFKHSIPF